MTATVAQHLAALAGDWTGTNRMRLRPDDDYAPSPSRATVATPARGNVLTLAYTWVESGNDQEGFLVVARAADAAEGEDTPVSAVWVDSWHQAPAWMAMRGTVDGAGVVRLAGTYDGGGWQITVDPTDGTPRLLMDNVWKGTTYQVVEATYQRAAS